MDANRLRVLCDHPDPVDGAFGGRQLLNNFPQAYLAGNCCGFMDKALLVGAGGFIGSVLRYWLSGVIQQSINHPSFPFGTLAVNLTGCLLIGFLSQLADARGVFTPETRAFVFVGILGGFTTFSTFGNESMNLLRDGEALPAIWNIGAHIFAGLAAVWLGRTLAYWLWR
jgi:CrcB protein